ncbi:MAG: undecaprenyl-phosphate galactose phosphotransferase WbaP [Treponema sp.]|nr:undecaprenyl-phosphate galactose phosphotransferase WbaP [Treponema sp.]
MTVTEFKQSFKKTYPSTSSFTSGVSLLLVDAFTIMFCICCGFFIVNAVDKSLITFRSFIDYAVYLPLILCVFFISNLYPGIMLSPSDEVRHLSLASALSFIGIAISISIEDSDRIAIIVALLIAVPVATICLPAARELARHSFAKCKWWGVPAAIFVNNDSGDAIIQRLLKRPDLGYKPALIVDSSSHPRKTIYGIPVFTPSPELTKLIQDTGIKIAFLCDYTDYTEDSAIIMNFFRYTVIVPRTQGPNTMNLKVRDLGGILGFSSTHDLTKWWSLLIKRSIDLLLLLLSSPIVLPVTLLLAICVKLTSKGPIFYGHKRIGKNHKVIKCWKFRSMITDADKMLDKILEEHPEMREEWERDRKFTNDPRVTKFGKILRKTSLDEIPQLFNILTGEMSFVGPRPVTEPELQRYGDYAETILSVQPGLSGMWQISGRSDTGYEERVTLDMYYIQNWSIWLDLWIIIKTIWVVINGKGAY